MNSPAFACVSWPSTTCRTTARRSSSLLLISTSSWATDPPFRRRRVAESGHFYLARSGHFHFAATRRGRISVVLCTRPPLCILRSLPKSLTARSVELAAHYGHLALDLSPHRDRVAAPAYCSSVT